MDATSHLDGVDTPALRKARGAFFTRPAIADFLMAWAVNGHPHVHVLDPTCSDGVFLLSAVRPLQELGAPVASIEDQVAGIDLEKGSLEAATGAVEAEGAPAHLVQPTSSH